MLAKYPIITIPVNITGCDSAIQSDLNLSKTSKALFVYPIYKYEWEF